MKTRFRARELCEDGMACHASLLPTFAGMAVECYVIHQLCSTIVSQVS